MKQTKFKSSIDILSKYKDNPTITQIIESMEEYAIQFKKSQYRVNDVSEIQQLILEIKRHPKLVKEAKYDEWFLRIMQYGEAQFNNGKSSAVNSLKKIKKTRFATNFLRWVAKNKYSYCENVGWFKSDEINCAYFSEKEVMQMFIEHVNKLYENCLVEGICNIEYE